MDHNESHNSAPQVVIELIRRPDVQGFRTVSYKVTVEGGAVDSLAVLDLTVEDMENKYHPTSAPITINKKEIR